MLAEYPWEEVTEYLGKLRRRTPAVLELVDFAERVLAAQYAFPARPELARLGTGSRAGRNQTGSPLATPTEFVVDPEAAGSLFHRLVALFRERGQEGEEVAAVLSAAYRHGEPDTGQLLRGVVSGAVDLDRVAADHGLAPELLDFLVRESVRPSLECCARELGAFVEEAAWLRPICPVCGSEPRYGEVRAEETTAHRFLTCAFCGWRWRYYRTGCVFCGGTEAKAVEYLFAEEDPRCKLECCAKCQRYLKLVDCKEYFDLIPFLEVLATPHLDLLAQERGYRSSPA